MNLNCELCKKENEVMLTGFISINPLKVSDFKEIPLLCEDCLSILEDCVVQSPWGDNEDIKHLDRKEWFEKEVLQSTLDAQKEGKNIVIFGLQTELTENFKILEVSNLEKLNKFIKDFKNVEGEDINSLFFA